MHTIIAACNSDTHQVFTLQVQNMTPDILTDIYTSVLNLKGSKIGWIELRDKNPYSFIKIKRT